MTSNEPTTIQPIAAPETTAITNNTDLSSAPVNESNSPNSPNPGAQPFQSLKSAPTNSTPTTPPPATATNSNLVSEKSSATNSAAPAIPAIKNAESTQTSSARPASKTRSKSKFNFLPCFGCFGPSGYEENSAPPKLTPSVVTAPNPPIPSTNTENEKSVAAADPSEISPALEEENLSVTTQPVAPSPAGTAVPLQETEGVTSAAVMPPGKDSNAALTAVAGLPKSRPKRTKKNESIITSVPEPGQPQFNAADNSEDDDMATSEDESEEDIEQSLILRGGVGIPIGPDGLPQPLLSELTPEFKGKKCLVLDLDETLVHSSFKVVPTADYVVPVEIENQFHNVYVIKRPGVDQFLIAMGKIYEIVIFTASLSKYADPVLDQLDGSEVVQHRLFRESCYNNKGNYVKDLSQLGRSISDCIILDNSPASYVFHVNNAVPVSSWFNDPHDTELTDLIPFLTDLERVDDVRAVLDQGLHKF